MSDIPSSRDIDMDPQDLWREEIFTDRRVGTLRVLSPVKPDGAADDTRRQVYVGEAQIVTNMGPLPISFEIAADSLRQAVENYGAAAKEAFDRTLRELQDLRRQAASSLVLPGQQGGFGPGGLGGGGLPPLGGGKIQMP
jgi:hypothetical protein